MTDPGPVVDDRHPADVITGMVDHVLELAATWPMWDGRPLEVPVDGEPPRAYTPHKAVRRVADHLVDHLAELEARLAGHPTEPDRWHGSMVTTSADLAAFTEEDLDEARSRLRRLALIWEVRLRSFTDEQLDAAPGDAWTLRQVAFHVTESAFYADSVGTFPRWPTGSSRFPPGNSLQPGVQIVAEADHSPAALEEEGHACGHGSQHRELSSGAAVGGSNANTMSPPPTATSGGVGRSSDLPSNSPGIELTADPALTESLRSQLVATWVTATNNGGAVGFLPPITAAEVRPVADQMFGQVDEGSAHLVVAQRGSEVLGWVLLEIGSMPLISHWAWFKRLMVLPSMQGQGLGRRLTAAAVDLGRDLGLEQLYLTCRSATGLADFYGRLGWLEVGRMPRNLRLADGSYRDEIYMVFELLAPGISAPQLSTDSDGGQPTGNVTLFEAK